MEPLGDAAFILRELGDTPAYAVARWLDASEWPGLEEVNAAYDTVGLYVNPDAFDVQRFKALVESGLSTTRTETCRKIEIPSCYEMGEDLEACVEELGLARERFVELHSGSWYTCFAVGFCPGFPYLGYLPDAISGLDRLAKPRTRVPAGSVAITGKQAGVYPLVRPGGWRLVARTPLQLVSLEDGYFPIRAGDQVRFVSIDEAEFRRLEGKRL